MVKKMRACSSASGGVMFLPDEDNETNVHTESVSYKDLVQDEKSEPKERKRLFGRKKVDMRDEKAA